MTYNFFCVILIIIAEFKVYRKDYVMDRNKIDSENYFFLNVSERTINKNIPTHWHDYYEVEVCLEGEGTMTINGKNYEIKPKTLYFLTPSDFHNYKITKKVDLVNLTFPPHCVEYSQIQSLLLITHHFVSPLDSDTFNNIIYLIKQISQEINHKKYMSKKYISNLMSCFLINLLRLEKQKNLINNPQYPISIQKAVYHVMSNFKKDITLESTAKAVYISPGHLSKEFHKNIGITFKDFLTNLRLDYSCQLLLYSNESITNIAFYCGFNSVSYFLRVFKKKYEISPLKYRKLYQTNNIDA